MNSALTIHGVPDWHTRKQHRATLERTTDVCDRLQAAMFHLANDRGDLARRSLRSAFALHERMVRHHAASAPRNSTQPSPPGLPGS